MSDDVKIRSAVVGHPIRRPGRRQGERRRSREGREAVLHYFTSAARCYIQVCRANVAKSGVVFSSREGDGAGQRKGRQGVAKYFPGGCFSQNVDVGRVDVERVAV